jgi:hypothetical protein
MPFIYWLSVVIISTFCYFLQITQSKIPSCSVHAFLGSHLTIRQLHGTNIHHRRRPSNSNLHLASTENDNVVLEQWDGIDDRLQQCTSSTKARRIIEQELLPKISQQQSQQKGSNASSSSLPILYKSIQIPVGASKKGLSDGDLAIQTRLINTKYKIMDVIDVSGNTDSNRASISIGILFVISSSLALLINQSPIFVSGPDIIRFILVWICVFAPLGFIGYGIRDAEALQSIFMSLQQQIDPSYRQRIIQHEAGHFLMGHLLGWPIQGYNILGSNNVASSSSSMASSAVQFYPLSDPEIGTSYAQQLGFDRKSKGRIAEEAFNALQDRMSSESTAPYYSKNGRGGNLVKQQSVLRNGTKTSGIISSIDPSDDPRTAWPYRGFSDTTLDMISAISVAGVCAEILAMGNAQGGRADFDQLKQILSMSSEDHEAMTDREMDNRLRYSLGFTMSVLRRHLRQLDALASVMERNGSITECIQAIETSTIGNNDATIGVYDENYERRRREMFRSYSVLSTMQQVFQLRSKSERNIDTVEDRLLEGKGGGSRKQVYRLTGDDPLYAAITVAIIFLLWAISGGLTLH